MHTQHEMNNSLTKHINLSDSAFSSIDLVAQCLLDRTRSEAFDRAIRSVIQPNHVVLEAGTGSGLLALFAARAGARHVVALEFDPYVAAIARSNVRQNGYEDMVEIIETDARNHQFVAGTHFDVVITEMLTTGCVDEYQVQAINNLHRQCVVSPATIFIPEQQLTYATLAQTQFDLYGLQFPMVRHQWKWIDRLACLPLSERRLLNGINFARGVNENFSLTLPFAIGAAGKINSLYLNSVSMLTSEVSLHDTLALNGPVVIPLTERLVHSGEQLYLRVSYQFGGGFESLSTSWE